MVIGRQDAAINLNDPRVSSVHARVIREPDGRFRLRDNESKNGIRDSAGQKVAALELKPGLRFGIGESQFEVLAPEPAHAPRGRTSSPRAGHPSPPLRQRQHRRRRPKPNPRAQKVSARGTKFFGTKLYPDF